MSSATQYGVLMATLPAPRSREGADPDLPELDRVPTPWEQNQQATCECLSWRGALDNLERRHAEDDLGSTVYAKFPTHARSAVVTAHLLIEAGAISEDELNARMNAVRTRFEQG